MCDCMGKTGKLVKEQYLVAIIVWELHIYDSTGALSDPDRNLKIQNAFLSPGSSCTDGQSA